MKNIKQQILDSVAGIIVIAVVIVMIILVVGSIIAIDIQMTLILIILTYTVSWALMRVGAMRKRDKNKEK